MDNGDAFADLVNTGSAFSSCGLPFVYMVHAETKFVLSSVKRSRSPQVNLITEVMASEITAQQPRRKKKGRRRIFRAMFFPLTYTASAMAASRRSMMV